MSRCCLDVDRVLQETFAARAEHYATLASTSDRAAQAAAEAPGPLPLLVVADEQTAGRGRGTHRWWTGRGSLAISLLIGPEQAATGPQGRSPLVALATAVAVVETVAPRLPSRRVGIRWPNDVFAAGRKLAGILVEGLPDGRHVVGIGLNTNNTLAEGPPELRQIATTLLELTGEPHNQTEILIALLKHLEDTFRQLVSQPERIGERADELCLQRGETLSLQQGRRTITGLCAGIAPDGALLLDTAQGRRAFYSGVLGDL